MMPASVQRNVPILRLRSDARRRGRKGRKRTPDMSDFSNLPSPLKAYGDFLGQRLQRQILAATCEIIAAHEAEKMRWYKILWRRFLGCWSSIAASVFLVWPRPLLAPNAPAHHERPTRGLSDSAESQHGRDAVARMVRGFLCDKKISPLI
jgi:hypothetical protein